jgi:FkbM family methyltransferase
MNIEVVLKHVVNRGDTVFDVGGYVGNVAWFMTRCVGPTGRVFSFEPNPKSFLALKAKADKYPNLKAFNCAVSNSQSPVTLYFGVTEVSGQAATICSDLMTTERLGEEIKSVEVPATTLDKFCADHGLHPTVIKIDVEGAEALVLEGAGALLESEPTLILEMGITKTVPEHVTRLRSRGYELYFIELHRFVSEPASWDYVVNTETPSFRNCIIAFTDTEAERLSPFFSNVLAISQQNRAKLSDFRVMAFAEAIPLLSNPKRSLAAKIKRVVRKFLIPNAVEEHFPGFVAILRTFGRRF